ncbi:MAG: beta-ketoacyl-ACP synthase III [Eubacteriales bacterium]
MNTTKIISTGNYCPDFIVSNLDLEQMIDTTDEWIYSRTGIKERRISKENTTLDLTYRAALNAIEKNNIDVNTIGLIIVATVTPDYFIPSTASLLQGKLGMSSNHVTCFDVNAACTGLIYGLQIANKFIASGTVQRALVVGAEIFSKVIDWDDRSTCVLFGDGAGAVIIEKNTENLWIDYTNSMADEELHLCIPGLSLNHPFKPNPQVERNNYLTMNGGEIFKFATFAIKDAIEYVLEQAGLNIEDIKYIVPHQANQRIVLKIAKMMNIPIEKFYLNLQYFGNTSAASIGIALNELYDTKVLSQGDKVILIGFGGGLTWGSILFEY